jgi:L-lactate dehydrogenase complex protein LldF
MLTEMGTRLAGKIGKRMPNVGPLKKWTRVRTSPKVARTSLHQRARNEGVKDE